MKPTPPFIPGHEAIGLIAAVGSDVTVVKEGDRAGAVALLGVRSLRVLLDWLGNGVRSGEVRPGGYTRNVGFADYLLADPNYVAHVLVCAIDIDDGKLAHATRLGADFVIDAETGDPAAAVKKATGGGAGGVLITAPSLIAFKQGVGMARKRGTCVRVGLPPGEFPVPLFDVAANCITIRGSFVGTRHDMAEALAFAVGGRAKADIELQPPSSMNQIFDCLEHGNVPSRVVLDFAPAKTKSQRSER